MKVISINLVSLNGNVPILLRFCSKIIKFQISFNETDLPTLQESTCFVECRRQFNRVGGDTTAGGGSCISPHLITSGTLPGTCALA
jgi:hypothetical protein